jgi:hypothetical protein
MPLHSPKRTKSSYTLLCTWVHHLHSVLRLHTSHTLPSCRGRIYKRHVPDIHERLLLDLPIRRLVHTLQRLKVMLPTHRNDLHQVALGRCRLQAPLSHTTYSNARGLDLLRDLWVGPTRFQTVGLTMRPPGASFWTSLSGMDAAAAPTWMASYCRRTSTFVPQHGLVSWVLVQRADVPGHASCRLMVRQANSRAAYEAQHLRVGVLEDVAQCVARPDCDSRRLAL